MKLSAFVQKQWSTVWPDVPLKWGWAPEAICDHLEAVTHGRIKNLMINVPPAFGMTAFLGVFWPAWEWHSEGKLSSRFGKVSYSPAFGPTSTSALRRIHGGLGRVEVNSFTSARLENGIGGSAANFGMGSAVCGERFDRLSMDCANNPHSTPAMLERDWEAFSQNWVCHVPPRRGSTVISQFRIGDGDLTDRIVTAQARGRMTDYIWLVISMEFDERRVCETPMGWKDPRSTNGELAWPERFDRDWVDGIKGMLGRDQFDRSFQQLSLPLTIK